MCFFTAGNYNTHPTNASHNIVIVRVRCTRVLVYQIIRYTELFHARAPAPNNLFRLYVINSRRENDSRCKCYYLQKKKLFYTRHLNI